MFGSIVSVKIVTDPPFTVPTYPFVVCVTVIARSFDSRVTGEPFIWNNAIKFPFGSTLPGPSFPKEKSIVSVTVSVVCVSKSVSSTTENLLSIVGASSATFTRISPWSVSPSASLA